MQVPLLVLLVYSNLSVELLPFLYLFVTAVSESFSILFGVRHCYRLSAVIKEMHLFSLEMSLLRCSSSLK